MINEYRKAIDDLREYFSSGQTLNINKRLLVLRELEESLKRQEGKVLDALYLDLNKGEYEAFISELSLVYAEISLFLKKLKKWSKTSKSLTFLPGPGYFEVAKQPYGVVLIVVPFNYPLLLALVPLIGAIAAGNCVVVRFSKASSNTAKCLQEIINNISLNKQVIILPGNQSSKDLINKEKFDYIFFTGSAKVGKIFGEKAARDLTPITLELGGKNPCIVDKDVDIEKTAKRILFGKLMNAGQTCVAVDYLVVHQDVVESLILALKKEKDKMVDELVDKDWPRIVDDGSFVRLRSYLYNSKIIFGGEFDQKRLKMQLSVIIPNNWEHPSLNEEIFGPILPILTYNSIEEVLVILKKNPDPLALYVFTKDKKFFQAVRSKTRFGSACLNDTLLQITNSKLPFGGVGDSGMGCYHGYYSYRTFSYETTVLMKGFGYDSELRYRPYLKNYKKIKKFMKGA